MMADAELTRCFLAKLAASHQRPRSEFALIARGVSVAISKGLMKPGEIIRDQFRGSVSA